MLVVTPDGYIVNAGGLYMSDFKNNDAQILVHMLEKKTSRISKLIENGERFILDRGFCQAKQYLDQKGYLSDMSDFLQEPKFKARVAGSQVVPPSQGTQQSKQEAVSRSSALWAPKKKAFSVIEGNRSRKVNLISNVHLLKKILSLLN